MAQSQKKEEQIDLFSLNMEQTRKIFEMEKQVEYWQDKCLESKLNLNTKIVEENAKSKDHEQKVEDTQTELNQKIKDTKKELDQLKKDNKILNQQIAQKDNQILTFQKQTQSQFDEIIELQDKVEVTKKNKEDALTEQENLKAQLKQLEKKNQEIAEKQKLMETPEAYLDHMSRDKDLNAMLHYCQLVNAKYMQLMSQKYLEQLSQGGPGAAPPQLPGMPAFPAAGGMQQPMYNPMQYQQMGMGQQMQMPGMMANPAASAGAAMPNMMGQPGGFGPMVPQGFGNNFQNSQ